MINFVKGLPIIKDILSPQPPSAGALDVLPNDVMIRILSYLPKPSEGSLVCRKMRLLTMDARKSEQYEQGICVEKLAKACGLSSINPLCIDVLRNFGVNLLSIGAREEQEIRQEFEQLFKNDLTLLCDPIRCGEFLFSRLKRDSEKIGKVFIPSFQPQPDAGMEKPFPEPGTEKKPARARATLEVAKLMEENRPDENFWCVDAYYRKFPKSINESLPLPPSELFLKWGTPPEQEAWQRLHLYQVSCLSSGIGSMTWIRQLSINDSTCSSFPPSIEQLDLQELWIYHCPNIQDLPPGSLKWIASLKTFSIHAKTPLPEKLLEKVCQSPLSALGVMCYKEPIEHLPKSLYEKRTLTHLLVLSSCTSELLQEISVLSLETLECGFYHSKTLPSSLLDMTNLRKICLLQHTKEEQAALDHDHIADTLRQRGVEVKIEQATWDPATGRREIMLSEGGSCTEHI